MKAPESDDSHQHPGDTQPWTPEVLDLLRDWCARADGSARSHFEAAAQQSSRNLALGVPVVILTTFVGTSVFATLQESVSTLLRVAVGAISVLAAVLASLQTFLRYAERAEKHRAAAEKWMSLRREMAETLALHPNYLKDELGNPRPYLDNIRAQMNEVAAESPEIPQRLYKRRVLAHRRPVASRPREDARPPVRERDLAAGADGLDL